MSTKIPERVAARNMQEDDENTPNKFSEAELNEIKREQSSQAEEQRRQDRHDRWNEHEKQIKYLRWGFSIVIGVLSVGWVLMIGIVVIKCASKEFYLPDNVLFALVAGATADILGMLYFIIKYLFAPVDSRYPRA